MKKNPKKTKKLKPASSRKHPESEAAGLDFKKIMEVLGETDVCEFEYSKGDMHIVLKKEPVCVMLGEEELASVLEDTAEAESAPGLKVRRGGSEKEVCATPCVRTLKSPAVGTFRVSDGDKLLSSVGEKIKKGRKIGWVNSMGIKQEIIAEKDAKITAIFCKDRDIVEWGQPLFEIEEENV